MHEFDADFYGEELKLLVLGFIRPEMTFSGLPDLVDRIRRDIGTAATLLSEGRWQQARTASEFFRC